MGAQEPRRLRRRPGRPRRPGSRPGRRTGRRAARRADDGLLDGLLHRDEVRDRTGIQLPDGEFDTLGGYVQDTLGRVPTVGDSVPLQDRRLVVEEMDGRRVATVRLEHSGEPDQAPARPTTAQLCGR